VIIDIGTGDGRFVYQSARRNPKKFYIGIDPNAGPLEKISEKIHRKRELHVHFPWGSLLRAIATAEISALKNLRRICSSGALREVVIGLNPSQDRSQLERLGITDLSLQQID
jgi:16S rRNA (adenine(1408)-N(1))-methyltransferase